MKAASDRLLHLKQGASVLDVGCGKGADAFRLSHLVGPGGAVVGVEADPFALRAAEAERTSLLPGAKNIQFLRADAIGLPFPDGAFDAVRSARLLQHLTDPDRAVDEMVRVLKPGGRLLLAEADHSQTAAANALPDVEWAFRRFHTESFRHGSIGRDLYGFMRSRRLQEVEVAAVPILITSFDLWDRAAHWAATARRLVEAGVLDDASVKEAAVDFSRRDALGTFFGCGLYVVVSGRRG